jgi:surface antigen
MNNLINHTFLVYQSQTFPTMFQKLKSMILVPMLIVFGTFMSVAQTYNAVSSAVCPTFNRTCSGYAYEGNAICIKLSSINGNTLNLSVYKTTGQAFTTAGNMLLMENDPCGNFIAEGRYSTSTMSKTLSTTLSFTSGTRSYYVVTVPDDRTKARAWAGPFFVEAQACRMAAALPSSPSNGSSFSNNTSSVTLSWNANGNAYGTQYYVSVRDVTTGQLIMTRSSTISTSLGVFGLVAGHEYRWMVSAEKAGCILAESNASSFTIAAPPQYGSVRTSINPTQAVQAGAQWNLDNGGWQNSDIVQSNISVGNHTINFKGISNWTTPASQAITVYANQTSTTSGSYVCSNKAINITSPTSGTFTAGQNITVNWSASACISSLVNIELANTGCGGIGSTGVLRLNTANDGSEFVTIPSNLAAGTYKVKIYEANPTGALYSTCTSGTITITQPTGSVRVTLTPAQANGQWNLDGGAYQNSGAILSNITVGNHTVTFKNVANWTAPTAQTVAIVANQTKDLTAAYVCSNKAIIIATPLSGTFTAGQNITVNWGASACISSLVNIELANTNCGGIGATGILRLNTANDGSEIVTIPTDLAAGTYKVKIYEANPTGTLYSICTNTTITIVPPMGSVRVSLTPAQANGQWSLDGGTYQNSGAILSNVSVANHVISFKPVANYITPASQTIAVVANQTKEVSAVYDVCTKKITIVSPTSGTFTAGQSINVNWSASACISSLVNIELANTSCGGIGATGVLKLNTANDGSETVIISPDLVAGTYKIKIYEANPTGTPFPICTNTTITVNALPVKAPIITDPGNAYIFPIVPTTGIIYQWQTNGNSVGTKYFLRVNDNTDQRLIIDNLKLGSSPNTVTFAQHNNGLIAGHNYTWNIHAVAANQPDMVAGGGKPAYAVKSNDFNFSIAATPVVVVGDDYPTQYKYSVCRTTGLCDADVWLFCRENCTSFVAWRINRDAGYRGLTVNDPFRNTMSRNGVTETLSHAGNWATKLRNLGYTVNTTPAVGCIAQWNFSTGLPYGHVAYVSRVNTDGTIEIEEYNWNSCVYGRRTILKTVPSNFIHINAVIVPPTIAAPILISPVSVSYQAVPSSITFSWNRNNAVGTANYFISLRDLTTNTLYNYSVGDAGSFTLSTGLVLGHEYQWTVKAVSIAILSVSKEPNATQFSIGQIAKGNVGVTITPPQVIPLGAKWCLDEGVWKNSGETLTNISIGSHTIKFQPVANWVTPASKSIMVLENVTLSVTGQYTPDPNVLTLNASQANGLVTLTWNLVPFNSRYAIYEGSTLVTTKVNKLGLGTDSFEYPAESVNSTYQVVALCDMNDNCGSSIPSVASNKVNVAITNSNPKGITVIIHGFSPTIPDASQDWMGDYAKAIKARAVGGIIMTNDANASDWRIVDGSISNPNDYNGEYVYIYNWKPLSTDLSDGRIEAAADHLFALMDKVGIWNTDKPIHFIAHSRGNIVSMQVFHRAARYYPNRKIDHFTLLDPHPATPMNDASTVDENLSLPGVIGTPKVSNSITGAWFVGDTKIKLPINILRADCYYRQDGIYERLVDFGDFDGIPVDGITMNRQLNNATIEQKFSRIAHSGVHDWYLGTIRLNGNNDFLNYNNNIFENTGINETRFKSGYYNARLGGGYLQPNVSSSMTLSQMDFRITNRTNRESIGVPTVMNGYFQYGQAAWDFTSGATISGNALLLTSSSNFKVSAKHNIMLFPKAQKYLKFKVKDGLSANGFLQIALDGGIVFQKLITAFSVEKYFYCPVTDFTANSTAGKIGSLTITFWGNDVRFQTQRITVDNVELTNDITNATLLSDFGTSSSLSAMISTTPIAQPKISELQVFPNPVANIANLTFDCQAEGVVEVQITDISGRLVDMKKSEVVKGSNVYALKTADLPNGLYIVRVLEEGQKPQIQKFQVLKQ